MSWFQSAVNTVREVTKAINKMTGPTFDPRCGALPFNDGIGGIRYNKSSASGSAQNESEDENDNEGYNSSGEGTSQSASATRITTRARITYELDRYNKSSASGSAQNESEDENDNEGYNSSGEGTSQSASATRITTRARITYELDSKRRPLLLLCDNINSMADTSDFVSILKKTVEDATKTIGLFEDVPIELSNTLSKEMRLAKS
ncbi:hypothetical protein MSG28_005273 [Choristoneura fumiferana]|uniref:Uncharacterized protein n=1 Tax=Choristoneura fumiferana TaxID=7141 RepID=A0ACC0JRB2_CHOFU|nr:hypothetical protein MSG28_005273 [Choristoneura fumiferana]